MSGEAKNALHRVARSTWEMHHKIGIPPPKPKDDETAVDYSRRLEKWRDARRTQR